MTEPTWVYLTVRYKITHPPLGAVWSRPTLLADALCSKPGVYMLLRKHAYSNILKILQPKKENFQIKNSDFFFIFLLKT